MTKIVERDCPLNSSQHVQNPSKKDIQINLLTIYIILKQAAHNFCVHRTPQHHLRSADSRKVSLTPNNFMHVNTTQEVFGKHAMYVIGMFLLDLDMQLN